jgi:rubrerythrin
MYDGLPFVQVVTFRVEEQGTLRIPEYYCDVCTITVRYPQVCPCCQGDMELRYRAGS